MLLRGTGTNGGSDGVPDKDNAKYDNTGPGGGGPASMFENKDN